MKRQLVKRNPALVRPPRSDPRPKRDHEYVQALAADMAARGLRNPPYIVRRGGVEEIVTGEHRRLAGVLNGWTEMEFYLVDDELTDADLAIERLQEAEMHKGFSPLERAAVYQQLLQQGMTRTEIAERTGRDETAIAKDLRIKGNLAPELQADVESARLGISAAYILAMLPDHAQQREWAQKLYAGQLKRDTLYAKVKVLLGKRQKSVAKTVKLRTAKGAYSLPGDFAGALADLTAIAAAVKKAEQLGLPMASVVSLLKP